MNNGRKKTLALAILLTPFSTIAGGPLLQVSEPISLGQGEFRVFGAVTGNGYPLGMGIVFDRAVFDNAPQEPSDGQYDILDADGNVVWPCCGHELDFDVTENIAAATAFTHITINWNPGGHPPPDVYTVPHLDFHFYTQSRSDRLAITPPKAMDMCTDNEFGLPVVPLDCEQLGLAMQPLPEDQRPPNHTNLGAVEPAMGNHWIDLTSPEFHPHGSFSHTFIFGSWKGELTFWEPMISQAYLSSFRNARPRCFAIENPSAAPEAGWYPSEYCVQYLPGQEAYSLTMTDFEWLPASSSPNLQE